MKIGRISRFLMFSTASLFLHAAALPTVVRFLVPRGRAPATEVVKRNIHPVELFSPRPELAQPIFRPQIVIHEFKLPEIPKMPEPVSPPLEKPQIAQRRRSASRLAEVVPLPPPPEPIELPAAEPIPVGTPTMPVGYFLAHPGGLATEPTSQEVIREVALDSMRRAELNPTAPAPQQPERSEDQREQLLSEGCWILQNGTGTIRCPSWHPSNQPTPVYQETEDGFMVGMHDPSATFRSGPERRFRFERQENGDYIYRDPDGRNEIIIHPNGRMEDRTNLPPPNIYILGYPVFGPPPASPAINPASGLIAISITFPWDNPPLPHSMWSEIEESTRGVRRQVAENYDASVTRETLDGLSIELKQIIEKHTEWSLAHQHDFLFRRWDECREDSVGNEARTTIEEFIRQHYRQGGRLEFTEEEIRGFNERRRTESQSFCPYGCLPDMVLQEPQVGDSL